MQICSISDCRSFDALRNKTPSMPGGWEPSQDREQESVGGAGGSMRHRCDDEETSEETAEELHKKRHQRLKGPAAPKAPQCQKLRSAKSSAAP